MSSNYLFNKKVLITAGPTREAIDPVRYISNHSSGKMRYAILVCNTIIMAVAFINPWVALALSFAMWIYWTYLPEIFIARLSKKLSLII
jgi:hypothetical protein